MKKVHFLNDLLEKHQVANGYQALHYSFNDAPFYETDTNTPPETSQVIIAFPTFLKPTFQNDQYKTKKSVQKYLDSYGIIISPNITNISHYINEHFSKSSRTPILKKMKRLESCFNINYKVFYGYIDKNHYEYLMDTTHAMLIKRFKQKNDTSYILNNWKKYKPLFYSLINQNRASLFIIYNNEIPIQVSINFHYGKTFFAYIPAYDIDYAQFGLGNTAVYKQLEWCIENNYAYLDMGNGGLEYKKRWCNYHYQLETHIHYKINSLKSTVLANKELITIKIKNILKGIIKKPFFNKLKQKLSVNKHINEFNNNLNYSIENIKETESPNSEYLQLIDLKTTTNFPEIKKPFLDFLYNTQNHMDTVRVYNIINETDAFLIIGSDSCIKIIFDKKPYT